MDLATSADDAVEQMVAELLALRRSVEAVPKETVADLFSSLGETMRAAVIEVLCRRWPDRVTPSSPTELLAKDLALRTQKDLRYTDREAVAVYLAVSQAIASSPIRAAKEGQIA
jgi:hypothetical protein